MAAAHLNLYMVLLVKMSTLIYGSMQMSADFCVLRDSNKNDQRQRSKTSGRSTTHFEEFEQQSCLVALAQISLPGVAALAAQHDVDVVDGIKVVGVTGLHLHHVPRHFGHNSQPRIRPVQALADISRSGPCCLSNLATKPVHRLQIRSTVHN